jgi:hypothetical protein
MIEHHNPNVNPIRHICDSLPSCGVTIACGFSHRHLVIHRLQIAEHIVSPIKNA